MKIAVLKSAKRVAIVPNDAKALVNLGHEVFIEFDAGVAALFPNTRYENCTFFNRSDIKNISPDMVFCVDIDHGTIENINIKECVYIASKINGNFTKLKNSDELGSYIINENLIFSLNMLPRITKAQSMDVLSSQNNLVGYAAAIECAKMSCKVFPMMTTSAGRISPAKVVVIGVGVAGLQAIATFKRLGAIVYGCDVRESCENEVQSLGAKFIKIPTNNINVSEGYVTNISDSDITKQKELLYEHIVSADIILCNAIIRGQKAPIIISDSMIDDMKNGALIMDLAIESGGNCSKSVNGLISHNGVWIFGKSDFAEELCYEASILLSKNYMNFFNYLQSIGYISSYLEKERMSIVQSDDMLSEIACLMM